MNGKVLHRIEILFYSQSLIDCGSSKLYLSVSISVCLSRFIGLYISNYASDFDKAWWKCWNLGLVDCVRIS